MKRSKIFLLGIELVGIDEEITRVFGRVRGRLRGEGKTIGDFDFLIGATALHLGLTLLTNNRRHFRVDRESSDLRKPLSLRHVQ